MKSEIAHIVWDHFAQKIHKPNLMQSVVQLQKLWSHGVSRRSHLGMTIGAIIFYGMWEIWKTRCTLKFDDGRFDAHDLLRRIYNHIVDCTRVMQPRREPSTFEKICLQEIKCTVLK